MHNLFYITVELIIVVASLRHILLSCDKEMGEGAKHNVVYSSKSACVWNLETSSDQKQDGFFPGRCYFVYSDV
jgi:hypothetical protein